MGWLRPPPIYEVRTSLKSVDPYSPLIKSVNPEEEEEFGNLRRAG